MDCKTSSKRSKRKHGFRGRSAPLKAAWVAWLASLAPAALHAEWVFQLPTPNDSLLKADGEAEFYQGTAGHDWPSGTFGCVRNQGERMHEGIDIRCLMRNEQGEAADPIFATAAGKVVYVNDSAGLSKYGRYIVLEHRIDDLPIYSLYAHLSEVEPGIRTGRRVDQGDIIGTLGRSAAINPPISQRRAHLHFELNLMINERFDAWFDDHYPGSRNDHGRWMGWNLVAIDPTPIFRAQMEGKPFRLRQYLRTQTELFRVLIPEIHFSWLERYPYLIRRNAVAERQGFAAYEVAFNYNGLPFRLTPLAKSEIDGPVELRVLSVNESEHARHHCRDLIVKRGQSWQLAENGRNRIDLLTFR